MCHLLINAGLKSVLKTCETTHLWAQNVSYVPFTVFFFFSSGGDVVSISCGHRMNKCVMIPNCDAAPVRAALAAPSVQG